MKRFWTFLWQNMVHAIVIAFNKNLSLEKLLSQMNLKLSISRHFLSLLSLTIFFFGCKEEANIRISPVCEIVELQDGDILKNIQVKTIHVNAYDEDGTIESVDFYINGSLLESVKTVPYSTEWVITKEMTGQFNLLVTVVDNEGNSTRASIRLFVIAFDDPQEPPVADFSTEGRFIQEFGAVQFIDSSQNNPNSWIWDFGDGEVSEERNPQHFYLRTGRFTVSLVVSNYFGSDTITRKEHVYVYKTDPRNLCLGCDTVSVLQDIDGNTYETVKIGPRLWMAENLKVTKLNDGTPIPEIKDAGTWAESTTMGYCWYDNDSIAYANPYGALYNYYTVDTKKLCPTGWHVANDDDWNILLILYGGSSKVTGGALKEEGTKHWTEPNTGATNQSGLTLLPGGFRIYNGGFAQLRTWGCYWRIEDKVIFNVLHYDSEGYSGNYYSENGGASIRCVLDRPK